MAEFALNEAEYAERIAAIHEWIRAGDVYQLNFTAPLRVALRDVQSLSGLGEAGLFDHGDKILQVS